MCFHNLVQMECPADLDFERPFRDLLCQLVQRCVHEILRVARVACQVYRSWDCRHRSNCRMDH
jgi:hypothetical protein